MAVAYSQNGVIVKNNILDFSKLELEQFNNASTIGFHGFTLYSNSVNPSRICYTPVINFTNANSIKIHFEYSVNGYSSNGYSTGIGEFYSKSTTIRYLISILNSATSLRISRGNPIINTDIPVSYILGTRIIVDIDINSITSIIKVKYGAIEVANEILQTNSLVINNCKLAIGGLRFDGETGYCLNGEIYLDSCYIMVDDILRWGVK